ncbi:toll/interleukin-1 receptor domain-containing protein [Rhodococcus qingshengii]|uniref:toll/interleukin-1 receptor domain-containing protein n=1 Tax=Rhodococcus qingshengii TaxID=334542 RepID=UPI0037CC65A4
MELDDTQKLASDRLVSTVILDCEDLNMAVTYRVRVLHVDRPEWFAALGQAVAAELEVIGMHQSVVVDLSETALTAASAPSLVVVLVGPMSKSNLALSSEVSEAVQDGQLVIPVVDDLQSFSSQAPDSVSAYNGFEWSGHLPEQRLARILLEQLGIEDRDRMVFLSHKRSDGLGAAEQLHDVLAKQRFVPFIDRFAIPFGAEVQREIADALEQFAFLLLLETPDAHLSEWVFYEIDYALSHSMGILIVQWPNNPSTIPGSDRLPRYTLEESDVVKDDHGYDVLAPDALDRLMREIEKSHAHGIVRRRRMLVSNVEEAAETGGGTCISLKDWMLDVSSSRGRSIVAIAPRLPIATDLQSLDETREQIAPEATAVLVHSSRQLREPRRAHLAWVTGGRSLELVPGNAIGAYW